VLVNSIPSLMVFPSSTATDVNHSMTFTASVMGGSGSGTISWTFGDGSNSTGSTVSHSWAEVGTYFVNASYQDGFGVSVAYSLSVEVSPSVHGTFSVPNDAIAGIASTFIALASGGNGPYAVLWNFGDGSQGTGAMLTHAYAVKGNYTVDVSITDAIGATVNGSLMVQVAAPAPTTVTTTTSNQNFPLGLFLGILVGAALAAVVVYAVGPRRKKELPPQQPPATPIVPPAATAEWKED
jgi:hypothetical protein